jgi:LAO/AO transport system kinase
VVELADAVVFNKADGENELPARRAAQDFNQTLHYLSPATEGWETRAFTCSSLTGAGVAEIWRVIEDFRSTTVASGIFQQRRRHQLLEWLRSGIGESLLHRFHNHPEVKKHLPRLETEVLNGKLPPDNAAEKLIDLFLRNPGK